MIPRIAAVGTSFSPLPCQAWHGYGVTSAHPVEVEVVPRGLRAHPYGAAAVVPLVHAFNVHMSQDVFKE
jgi:hypothetical protein